LPRRVAPRNDGWLMQDKESALLRGRYNDG